MCTSTWVWIGPVSGAIKSVTPRHTGLSHPRLTRVCVCVYTHKCHRYSAQPVYCLNPRLTCDHNQPPFYLHAVGVESEYGPFETLHHDSTVAGFQHWITRSSHAGHVAHGLCNRPDFLMTLSCLTYIVMRPISNPTLSTLWLPVIQQCLFFLFFFLLQPSEAKFEQTFS